MIIISHRGYWKNKEEKNTKKSFDRSFSLGFGTETDVRDFNGHLVISHDIPDPNSLRLEEFLNIYSQHNKNLPLALNIKSDGLQDKLISTLEYYNIKNYFVFDMSVPDTVGYKNRNIPFFSRVSEYEEKPIFLDECSGIWLDAFNMEWYDKGVINNYLNKGKILAIVSSELHNRDHLSLWKKIKNWGLVGNDKVLLCTDIPEQGKTFFKI